MRVTENSASRTTFRALALAGVSAAALGLMAPDTARAVDFRSGEMTGSFDTTISLGANLRTEDPDEDSIGIANGGNRFSINGDDGNLNYDKTLVSLAARVTHELSVDYRNVGAFLRGSYFYDFVNADEDTEFKDLSDAAINRIGRDVELLDAFVYGGFDFDNGMALDIKVGNQVLSWGESTFIQNGINIINPVDVGAIRVPGSELRNALTPVPMVDATWTITPDLSLEGFYQFQWQETEPDPAGTFFSTNDFATPGGQFVFLGFGNPDIFDNPEQLVTLTPAGLAGVGISSTTGVVVPRGLSDEPNDQGQFGFALRYFSEELNGTEFGLYAINYHHRLPIISAETGSLADGQSLDAPSFAAGSRAIVEYPEDITVFGASFNTLLPNGTALQGEVSYRPDQPVQVDDVELLLASIAPIASAGACAADPTAPACAGTLAILNQNTIIRDLGGINATAGDPNNFNNFFDRRLDGFREYDMYQAQLTATHAFGPIPALDVNQWVLLAEVGFTYFEDLPGTDELLLEGPNTPLPGNASQLPLVQDTGPTPFTVPLQTSGYPDDFSWGYRVRARFDFLNAFGTPVNISPTFAFNHDVSGTTPVPVGNFIEDRAAGSIGVTATYLNRWQGSLQYTNFFSIGDDEHNLLRDRDFVSLSVQYSF